MYYMQIDIPCIIIYGENCLGKTINVNYLKNKCHIILSDTN